MIVNCYKQARAHVDTHTHTHTHTHTQPQARKSLGTKWGKLKYINFQD